MNRAPKIRHLYVLNASICVCLSAGTARSQQASPPMKAEIEKHDVLPPPPKDPEGHIILPSGFLGTWNVASARQKSRDPAVEKRFNLTMNNVLIITGKPGAYYLGSNTGFRSPVSIDSVNGNAVKLQTTDTNTSEFGEAVRAKSQTLDIHLMPGNRMFEGIFSFDVIFASGERVDVEYGVRGAK